MQTPKSVILVAAAVFSSFAQSPAERAGQALDLVLARKYEAFYALFSPEMKRAITLETYSAQVDRILALGAVERRDPPVIRSVGNSALVRIPLHWKLASLDFLVSWNAAGQIQGTWFRPPEPAPPERAPYARQDAFAAREVTVGDDDWKLPGTLLVPAGKGPFAALVLVHGSGPQGRDEAVGGTLVFRDLAEGLASRGIAVLRYDKRTLVYPARCKADANFTMTKETVEDAVRAAALLRAQPEVDPRRVFVLGHSQGGYMAPRILKADAAIAGAIVLAGNVRPLEVLVREQIAYLASLTGKPPSARPEDILAALPEAYLRDLAHYDPAAVARSLPAPLLILQGERDYQVTMEDFALWKRALGDRRNAAFISYPGLNHPFVPGEGKSSPAEYARPAHVSERVVEDIARWIEARR